MSLPAFRIAAAGTLVLAAAMLACHAAAQSESVASPGNAPANAASAPVPKLTGDYLCAISTQNTPYPPFRCDIRDVAGHLELAKLGGSQRFVGRITPDASLDFDFRGTYYCPYGACDKPVVGHFHRQDSGAYVGTFADDNATVRLIPVALAKGVFGDAADGGAAYGGAAYGGAGYAAPLQQATP